MKRSWKKAVCLLLISAMMLCGCRNAAEKKNTKETSGEAYDAGTEGEDSGVEKKEKDSSEDNVKPTEEKAGERENADHAEVDENELFNLYIEINNEMVDYFADVIGSYFECVEFQEEFVPLKEQYQCKSNKGMFYEEMDKAHDMAQKKQQKDDLDEMYLALYPVMRELAETIDCLEGYTGSEKGKEYHAIIWKDYKEYETLSDEFIFKLGERADARREEALEQLEAEGYKGAVAFIRFIMAAQEMQREIHEQVEDDSQILELDLEILQPLYDQYMETAGTCLTLMEDRSEMYREGFPVQSGAYNLIDGSIEDSREALTELFERVRNQEPLKEFELNSAFAADGSIRKFDEAVSDMIDNYNDMLSY